MKKILFLFALLSSSIIANAQNKFDNDSNYVYAGEGGAYKFYVNINSIKKDYEGIKFWMGIYLFKNRTQERNKYVRAHRNKKYLNYLYSKDYIIMDTDGSKNKILAGTDYDYNEDLLDSSNFEYVSDWDYIIPGSIMEVVANLVKNVNSDN